jgi:hypothetical protein
LPRALAHLPCRFLLLLARFCGGTEALTAYFLHGEESLAAPPERRDASLRGAKCLLEQCPRLQSHLALLYESPPSAPQPWAAARPEYVVPPERIPASDLFPAKLGGSAFASASSSAPSGLDDAPPPPRSVRSLRSDPAAVVGRRCGKIFEGDPGRAYWGTVAAYLPRADTLEAEDLWHVKYDDGDTEDWDAEAVLRGLAFRGVPSLPSARGSESAAASAARGVDTRGVHALR